MCVYVDIYMYFVCILWMCGFGWYCFFGFVDGVFVCGGYVYSCVCVFLSLSLSLSTYQKFSLVAVCKKHFQGLLPRVVGSKKTTLQLLLLATTTPSAASIPLSYGLFCWFGFLVFVF